MDIQERMLELRLQGLCCSQVILQMGLEDLGKENEDLIRASRALCNGLETGKLCGTLSAASCLLFLADEENAGAMNDQLVDWFEDAFGSSECLTLLDNRPLNKVELCPKIVEATYEKVCELLEDSGVPFGNE
ncbi:MAG: C-GCAxxG-C-C family protein [Bacillota bacterium]|nr:C-GCAxxG-C-C family protein [Bacillota bacterium]